MPLKVEFVIFRLQSASMPPPAPPVAPVTVLFETVLPVMVTVPARLMMPPPENEAVLPSIWQFVMVSDVPVLLIPPPSLVGVLFPETLQFVKVKVPAFRMPPPLPLLKAPTPFPPVIVRPLNEAVLPASI